MLHSLSIRDVVLIGRLDLSFREGLCVLTGETGAGKSILLDALGLALGARAEARMVRAGAAQAVVSAEFEVPDGHPALAILAEQDLLGEDGIILLRRTLAADGRSRAFVNDRAVGVNLLKQVGDSLVEIHGQFESQKLMNPASHRALLDAFGGHEALLAEVTAACRGWRVAAEARRAAAEEMERARRDEDFLRHAAEEIAALAPKGGEEAELAARRTVMMHGEKLAQAMNEAMETLAEGRGVEVLLQHAARRLERVSAQAEGRLDPIIAALDRAASEAADAESALERVSADLDLDPRHLEQLEERLFALRGLARKHGVAVDALAGLQAELEDRLTALEGGSDTLQRMEREEVAARAAFADHCIRLFRARRQAAAELDKAVAGELKPLRLGGATFGTAVEQLEPAEWSETGGDSVSFRVATNPGAKPGPLHKIASGGELARFMLALKVVLARADPVPTIVFDEVDAGVGGAIAAAVGERLARLGRGLQVLVVTHSPQVAAVGTHHWRVAKVQRSGAAETVVSELSSEERREEIARMLAGARVTDEARAAADSLLQAATP